MEPRLGDKRHSTRFRFEVFWEVPWSGYIFTSFIFMMAKALIAAKLTGVPAEAAPRATQLWEKRRAQSFRRNVLQDHVTCWLSARWPVWGSWAPAAQSLVGPRGSSVHSGRASPTPVQHGTHGFQSCLLRSYLTALRKPMVETSGLVCLWVNHFWGCQ